MSSSLGVSYNQWIPTNTKEASTFYLSTLFRTASYLTDPLCKTREYIVRSQLSNDLPTSSYFIQSILTPLSRIPFCDFLSDESYAKWVETWYLTTASLGFAILAPITTPVGIALRALAANTSSGPLHYRGCLPEKERKDNQLTHFFRNVCGIKAGYDIEEGAQMPIQDSLGDPKMSRLKQLIDQIKKENADVVCLNEVFDINDAHYIANALKEDYAHFVMNCGPRSIGPNSGLFFASKFSVSSVQFDPFPKEMLVGTATYCEKGVLIVDLKDSQGEIATIALTHAQHSDQVQHPTPEEKKARNEELQFIEKKIANKKKVVLTGDLNMDDNEMLEPQNAPIYNKYAKTKNYSLNEVDLFTWGGDSWYVSFGNRPSAFSIVPAKERQQGRKCSTACNLDHTMVSAKTMNVTTQLLEDPTPYDASKISRDTLSDHQALLSIITF